MSKKLDFMWVIQLPIITILVLIISIMFFGRYSDFASIINLQIMIRHNAFLILIVAGQALVMLSGNFDLSSGAIISASVTIFAYLLNRGISPWLALIIALLICVLVGVVNGVLITVCKRKLPSVKSKLILLTIQRLPSIIITLLIAFFVRRILLLTCDGSFIDIGRMGIQTFQSFFGGVELFGISVIFWMPYLLFLLLCIFLTISKTGKKIYMLGESKWEEEVSKKNELITMVKVYGISTFLSGMAGIIILFRMGGVVHPMVLRPHEWITIAISIVSGICILGGRGKLIGVFFGVALWAVLYYGLIVLNVHGDLQYLVIRVIMFVLIVLYVLLSLLTMYKKKRRNEKL